MFHYFAKKIGSAGGNNKNQNVKKNFATFFLAENRVGEGKKYIVKLRYCVISVNKKKN